MEDNKMLIALDQMNPVEVFTGPQGVEKILEDIENKVAEFVPDTSTAKGRKEIASTASKVSKSKVALDNLGKSLVTDWKTKAAKVDAARKTARDRLDALRIKTRQPLTDWEAAEEARMSAIKEKIQTFHNAANCQFESAVDIEAKTAELEAIAVDESFGDLQNEARIAKDVAMQTLAAMFDKQQKHEADMAELERLRKVEEERQAKEEAERLERERKEHEAKIAREAEERAKLEAEERVKESERKEAEAQAAAARAEAEKKEAAEAAERERIAAEQRAKEEKERAVKEAEAKAKAEADRKERERLAKEEAGRKEAEAKAADVEHRRTVNNAALEGLKAAGLSDAMAKKVITAIASGLVPNVKIQY